MASRTLFISLLAIGAILVGLYVTGYLQNASNVTMVLLFAIFALSFGLYYEFTRPAVRPVPVPAETIREVTTIY